MNELDKYTDKNHIENLKELYQDNVLISYALENAYNNIINSTNKNDTKLELLTPEQIQYINLFADGKSISDICTQLNIQKPLIIIWQRQNKLFNECIKLIKEVQAEEAENILWNRSINDDNAMIERMFAIKARKPEYRENSILPNNNIISLRISVNDKEIDTSQSYKTVEQE
jgi:hypothetical protein